MNESGNSHFILGRDYHLGDLLWLTPVLKQYREVYQPSRLTVSLPDRPINRILDHNPVIDQIFYEDMATLPPYARVHDLRLRPLAVNMLRDWRRYWPWMYYRDLWLRPRGQWLATYLRLGCLRHHRPIIELENEDRISSLQLQTPYVLLAPTVGSYSLPMAGFVWQKIKGWDPVNWQALAKEISLKGMEPVTLGPAGIQPILGTRTLSGLPIRQVAGVIERAQALVTVESGLWFLAAALAIPFIIVPWWLSHLVNWPAPMQVPYRLAFRSDATPIRVMGHLDELIRGE